RVHTTSAGATSESAACRRWPAFEVAWPGVHDRRRDAIDARQEFGIRKDGGAQFRPTCRHRCADFRLRKKATEPVGAAVATTFYLPALDVVDQVTESEVEVPGGTCG